ncbi:MAG: DNA-J related domain-containing protein [Spirochaetota bacterium]
MTYLLEKKEPVMEATVFREFLSEQPWYDDQLSLFVRHFSLFHALYNLKVNMAMEGYYIHTDPMRMAAVPYPEEGLCYHYDSEEGTFCGRAVEDKTYCRMHESRYRHIMNSLVYDPLREFYRDEKNVEYGESRQFNDVLNGVKTYVIHKRDVDHALETFDIKTPSRKIIQGKYRLMVKKFHPDRPGGNLDKMKDINRQYALLLKVFTI